MAVPTGDRTLLRELRIRNLAVIDEVRLDFGSGLTVLSGETGAGKSILVEALSLLVGGRGSADLVRAGCEKAVVEGRFDISDHPPLLREVEGCGVDPDDRWLIVRRELRRGGGHRAWLNGSPTTTTVLKRLGGELIDLHGQHAHQRLLSRGQQRIILDAFAGATELSERVREAHASVRDLEARVEGTRRIAAVGRERSDYLRFKLGEIDAAELAEGEEERLDREASRLSHSEELLTAASQLHAEIYEAEGSVVERLAGLGRSLEMLETIDPEAATFRQLHESALRELEELGSQLGAYRSRVEHDPGRLDEVRSRLDELYRLKRKYGDTVEDVIVAGREARRELEVIETSDHEIERLERELEDARVKRDRRAAELRKARAEGAEALAAKVSRTLPQLGMEAGELRVALQPTPEVGPHGGEQIEFQVALNAGFEPSSLAKVASGGEMSRLMLALKSALIAVDEVPVLVFDEIDAGIGGEVAHRVGDRLAVLGERHQVLVVTHLAQIAARAANHIVVDKRPDIDDRNESPRTVAQPLEGTARVRELARMLGGDPDSRKSRAHAEELLSTGA